MFNLPKNSQGLLYSSKCHITMWDFDRITFQKEIIYSVVKEWWLSSNLPNWWVLRGQILTEPPFQNSSETLGNSKTNLRSFRAWFHVFKIIGTLRFSWVDWVNLGIFIRWNANRQSSYFQYHFTLSILYFPSRRLFDMFYDILIQYRLWFCQPRTSFSPGAPNIHRILSCVVP